MEIEAKFKLKSPSRLRALLGSANAKNEGEAALERNWLYDHSDMALSRSDKLLRLRQDARVRLTFKGPRRESEYKRREELELGFPDISMARSLLESIGFISWFYYEKYRETWKLSGCEIMIDELPELGLFVEIEGPTEAEIAAVVKRLKLPRRHITDTYVDLLRKHSRNSHERTQELKFSAEYKSVLMEKKKSWR